MDSPDPVAVASAPRLRRPFLSECVMPKTELDGLPVIDTDESEELTIAVKPEEGDEADPEQHPIAIALRRQRGVDDARVSKREVLVRRGENGSDTARRSGFRKSAGHVPVCLVAHLPVALGQGFKPRSSHDIRFIGGFAHQVQSHFEVYIA
jgi:hypothetical protein